MVRERNIRIAVERTHNKSLKLKKCNLNKMGDTSFSAEKKTESNLIFKNIIINLEEFIKKIE